MASNGPLDSIGDRESMVACPERESRLDCLRSLVCELLKTNQELREALLEARSGVSNHRNSG